MVISRLIAGSSSAPLRNLPVKHAEILAQPVEFANMPLDRGPLVVRQRLPRQPVTTEPPEQVGMRARGIRCACRIECTSFLIRVRCRTTW